MMTASRSLGRTALNVSVGIIVAFLLIPLTLPIILSCVVIIQ